MDAVLRSDGSIEGSFVETLTGEARSEAIGSYRGRSKTDYLKSIERWVGRSVNGAQTSQVDIEDGEGRFVLKGHFASGVYAQRPQPKMMIFRAAPLDHGELRLSEKSRKYPVVLDADALDETARIELPGDFKVDELPDAVRVDSAFGKFEASWKVESGSLVFKRKIEIPAQTVPAAQYSELRKFFDQVGGSAMMPVVLMK